MEELEELIDKARQAVPGVDAAIAAAIDRKVNPVSLHQLFVFCTSPAHVSDSAPAIFCIQAGYIALSMCHASLPEQVHDLRKLLSASWKQQTSCLYVALLLI